jgi:hypothetical protein
LKLKFEEGREERRREIPREGRRARTVRRQTGREKNGRADTRNEGKRDSQE